jgi:hypothetical protein
MQKTVLFILFVILSFSVVKGQQVTIKGQVVDAKTDMTLPFVNISDEEGKTGAVSDVDGLFSITLPSKTCCLKLSYVGYESKKYKVDYSKELQLIRMNVKPVELEEVKIVPGENPAVRIIKLAIEHVDQNNPKNLKEFSYISYDKMVVSVDSPESEKSDSVNPDLSDKEIKKIIDQHDFFLMETVTRRNYLRPGLNQEKVLATKVSGLKNPVMLFILSQLQSASFYDKQINIVGNKYVNPVSKGALNKYFFLLEDTVFNARGDTVFVITFRPKLHKKFDGLKGVFYINSDGWAIQNVVAQPLKDTNKAVITIHQSYRKIDSVWFPSQFKTDIVFKKIDVAAGDKKYPTVAKGTSYIKDVNLHPGLKKRDFGLYVLEVDPDAAKRDEEFWNKYRNDSLIERDKETYRIVDSLGKASNFGGTITFIQSMMTGTIPLGPLSIDLKSLIRYNVYEGFYLGLGLHTNRNFSKILRFGGFVGYGFKDEKIKYGVDASVMFHKATESRITVEYFYRPLESGGVRYFSDRHRELSPESFGDFFVSRKNLTKSTALNYSFRLRPLRDFHWDIGFAIEEKQAYGDYIFMPLQDLQKPQVYKFTKLNLEFRFAFREKIIQTPKRTVSMGSKYPVVTFRYTQGFKNVIESDVKFSRFDLRVTDKVETNFYGQFIWTLNFGYVVGSPPASELFAVRGTYRLFTLYAPNTFGTMATNEFLSDRYAALFLTWDFEDLLVSAGYWNPRLMLLTNIGIGSLSNPQDHLNYDFKTMEKGYFESGFVVRKLLDIKIVDFGLGIMFRYGPYSLPKTKDNFAYKLSIYYGL